MLAWGGFAYAYVVLGRIAAVARVMSAVAAAARLDRGRPLERARALPRRRPARDARSAARSAARIPLPAIVLLLAAALPLLVAIVLEGDDASHGLVARRGRLGRAASAGSASGRPLTDRAALDGPAAAARDRVRGAAVDRRGGGRGRASRRRSRCCARSPTTTTTPSTGIRHRGVPPPAWVSAVGGRLGRAARGRRWCCWRPARCRRGSGSWPRCSRCCSWPRPSPSGGAFRAGAARRSTTTRRMRPTDRHGARGRGRAAARVADGGPSEDAAAGRRRPHDPRHRARQPRRAGMETVVVVTGYAAERIEERRAALEQRHDVAVETVFNPKAEEWNNCLLAVVRARALRARRAALQRRHRAPARGGGAAAGRPRPAPSSCSRSTTPRRWARRR